MFSNPAAVFVTQNNAWVPVVNQKVFLNVGSNFIALHKNDSVDSLPEKQLTIDSPEWTLTNLIVSTRSLVIYPTQTDPSMVYTFQFDAESICVDFKTFLTNNLQANNVAPNEGGSINAENHGINQPPITSVTLPNGRVLKLAAMPGLPPNNIVTKSQLNAWKAAVIADAKKQVDEFVEQVRSKQ